ncbi:MAG: ATP-grasp domain-containing protein [Euzebya sp.]
MAGSTVIPAANHFPDNAGLMPGPVIGLATCGAFPGLDADDGLVIPALGALGATGVPVVWDDPEVDWRAFDAVLIRSTWDYPNSLANFIEWLDLVADRSVLFNAARLVRWNLDKGYLGILRAGGVPTVPTMYVQPGGYLRLPTSGEFVMKPSISAGSRDTARYDARRDGMTATGHGQRLLDAGRTVMIQPYLHSVDSYGETALLFIDGVYSHAIRKGALLESGATPTKDLFAAEAIVRRAPTERERAVADAALAAIPTSLGNPVYARVDLLMTAEGPVLLELELAEPSLFLSFAAEAAGRLAQAVLGRLHASQPKASR